MAKTYTKRLFLLAVFTLFILADALAQTITVGTVDPGPYGQGSSIAVPINVNVTGGCITQTNIYNVYLSDASGNFSPGTLIGSYSGFYAGFVNGIIPAGTPAGAGYKVEVKSTSPVVTSTVSAAFTISASPGVTPSLSSTETIGTNVFGRCVGTTSPYTILSGSSGTTASFNNETTGGNEGTNIAIPITGYSFTPTKSNYTITAKSVNGSGIVGTRDYQLINNNLLNPFSPVGQPFTCLPAGGKATLTFGMSFTGAIGINNNYPGTLYTVTWGDGTTSVFTYCDILQANGLLSHDYSAPTCGSGTPLQVICQPSTPFCGSLTSPATTTAKVLLIPTVDFTLPAVACVGTAITVPNNSKPGPDYSTATQTDCNLQNPNALYDWYFDGVKVLSGVKLGVSFTIPATTAHGTHTVLLHADAPADPNVPYCPATDVIKTICLENPPAPAFTIPSPVCITSLPVTVTNTSTVDNTCSTPAYTWTATGPGTLSFSGGTNKNSIQPQLNFSAAGTYIVKLSIASSCGAKTAQQTIVVQLAPTAVLSANVSFCGKNQTLTFDPTNGSSTKTTLSGAPATDTYAWTVTPALGGATYSFAGGTSASSQFPQITFTAYDTYTVKVSHTNSCGTVTATQQLTFIQPPLLSAGSPQTVCATPAPTVTLAGVASGAISSHIWSSAGGGTFSDVTKLNSTYTPSTAEITAGSATLTLTATSTSPCNTITSQVVITITPTAKVTSLPTAPLCSGSPLNYTITANLPGTTFTWTSVLTSGTATGFTASGSGNTITDVLLNTTTSDAVITYTILPTYNSCPGIPFTLKVTVHPLPVMTASAPSPVCSNVAGNGTVTLSSNVAGTTYAWTSTASAGITGNTNQVTPFLTSSINNTLVNSALTAGTVTYTITPYNGTCAGTPATVNIIVEPTPKTPTAGSDAEICASTTYTLNGNSPAPGTGLWTVSSGPAGTSFSDATSPTATVSGLIPGSVYQFTWTITASPLCPSKSDIVIVTVDKSPIGGTTSSNAIVCSGSNSGTITLAGQFGTVVRWESSINSGGSWQPIVNTGTTQSYLNLTQTTLYRAVLHNGVCPDVTSAPTTITVLPLPVVSNAGADDEVCSVTSYTLNGNNPAPGTGLWTVVSGPAGTSFSNATSPTATVSGLTLGGTYQFKWTITSSGTCPPSSDVVNITVDKSPIGGTTSSPATVCSGSNSGTITLAGQFGTVVRWESSIDNGATWQAITNTGTTQPYLNLTQTTQFRAVLKNGVCPNVTSTATIITVQPLPVTSNPGSDAEVCASTSYTLQGNNPSPGTGLWTVVSGPAGSSFSNNTSPTATVSGLIPGNVYQFKWTITGSASCPPSSNVVNITIDKSPVGGTTSTPATVCIGTNGGQVTLAGQFGTITRWESSINNGANWLPIANTSTIQPYLNLTQTTQYRAIVHNGVCLDVASAPTTITVVPLPVTSNAGPNDEVCGATSYTLHGNNPAPGTGKWTVTGPAGVTFSDATNPNAIANGLIPGSVYQFTWTITGSPACPSSSNTVTITIDKAPVGGTTSTNATVCISGNAGQITLSGQFGTIVRWESSINNGVTWLPIANTSTTQSFLNLTQTTQYRAILHNSTTCADVSSSVTTITVAPLPIPAIAGANDEVCNATSYALHGNNPAPGTGKWTVNGPAGVTFSDATNPNAIANGLIPGSIYQFTWTITTSPTCPSTSSTVTITIDKAPVGGIVTANPAEVCYGSNGGTLTLTGQFGTIFRWESSIDNGATWQAISNGTATQTFTNLSQTTQYRAILHNSNTCPDVASAPATVTVDPLPVASNPGPNDEVCNVTTYTLHGNSPAPGTGKWTITQGPAGATFSDATSPSPIVSGLIPGNVYQFKWTITSSSTSVCPPNSNTVNITIDQAPIGGTTSSPAEVCATGNGGQIKLTGQLGTVVRWESSVDNGLTWQPISNTGTTQSYLNLTQTISYRAVLHNGATCLDVNSTVTTITVDPPPVDADAGSDDEVCSVTSYNLNGNSPAPGTGKWTVITGPAGVTFSDATNPAATVSGLIPGNVYQFRWTITGSAFCAPSTDIVTIKIDKAPIGGTTSSPAEVCSGGNGGQIKLAGQFGNIVRWESSIDNGITWQPIANTSTTQSYQNLTQTTQYRAVLHNSTTCTDVTSTATTITVDPPPTTANAGTDDEVCSVTSYKLNGNNPAPGTGKWTVVTAPAPVTFSDATNPAAIVSGLIPGNVYQFRWTITGSAFCAPSTDLVTVTIDKAPIGGTTSSPAEVCSGGNGGQIRLAGQFGSILRWESSIDNGATWQPIANNSTTQSYQNLTQTTQYRAVLHNSTTCADVVSTATTITVDTPPTIADAGDDDEVCSVTSYKLNGNNPAPGTGKWTVVTGPVGVTFSDATNPAAIVSGLIPGNVYQFRWSITGSAFCPPSTDIVTVTIDKAPIGGTTSAPAEVCSGSNSGKITLAGQFGTIARWESSIDNGATWQPIANNITTQLYLNLTQTTQYRAVLHNGNVCTDVASTATTITVDPPPVTADAGNDNEVCNVTTYALNGNSPGTGTGNWTVVAGPAGATFSNSTNPSAIVSGLIPGNVYQFKWSITGSAFCPPSTDIVTITIDRAPIGGTTSAPAEVCSGNNGGQITLAGQFGTIVRWESSIDNGTTWQPIANTSTTQSYINITQTTEYRAILHNGNTCTDVASTTTTITVDTPPTIANAGAGDEVCNVTTYILHGNTPVYGTGLWTIVTGPPGVVFSNATNPSAILTGLIPGNVYQFKWTITGTATCPPSSSIVTIAIDQPPVGGTTSSPAEVCAGSNGGQIKLTGQFGNILRWESSINNGATWQPIANTNNTQSYINLTQTTQYRAVLHNGATCPDVTSTITTITVDPPPIAADAGVDDEVCSVTTYILNGNNTGTGTGKWTVIGGPAGTTFSDATKPNAIVSGLIPGNVYQFQWSITGTAACPPSTDIVTITIDKAPIGGTTSTPAEVCSGSNGGQITLSGQFGTVVRWESSINNGVTWQPIANTNITQLYLNLTRTTAYRAILHNSTTCADVASTSTIITVDPPPVTADAGSDDEVCSVTTYVLNGNNPSPGTGKWSVVGGPAGVTFSDVTNPAAIVSGLIPGSTYQFQWSITGTAACPPSTDIVTITIDKMPIGGTTSSPAEVCYGGNAGQIKLAGQFGSVVRWEFSTDNGTTWQAIANTGTTQPYINLIHTTQYRAILHNGATCSDVASTATTITVDPPPIDADAGPDDEVCSVISYNLHGNNPAPGTGKWTVVSGPAGATFSDATNPLATVSGLIPGNVYQFEWAITGTATCPPSTDIATIRVDKAPIGGTTSSPAEVCSGNNTGQITLSGQFGTIVRWEFSIDNGATWQPIANTSINQHFADLTQTTQFRAVLQNGAVCAEVASTATTITVDPPPVTSIPGPNDVVCNVTAYTLHANNPAPGTGKWTVVQGPAGVIFSDNTNPNATVSGLIPGNIYQFKWAITNTTACPPSSGVVTITVDQAPVGGTTSSAATVCWGSNSGQILLTGQFGTIVRWESSIDNGTTWQPIANSTTTQSYFNLTRTTQFRAFLHNGTSCADVPSAPTIITVNPPTPGADAGQDYNICNQTAITLIGNDPGTFSGTWTQTAGPIVNIVNPSSYSTQVTGLSGDNTYTFQWTIYGLPPCGNTSASINIGVHTDVVPSFTMNKSHGCGPTVVTFTNTSTPAPIGLFVWNFGDGTPTVTAINPPPHTYQPSSDGTEKTYTISMTPASNCGSQAPFVDKITVSPQAPVAAILPVQTNACGTFTVTARNLSPGNNVKYDFYLVDENNAIVQHLSYPDVEDAVFQPIVPTQPTIYTVYMIATDQCGNQSRTVPVNIPASPSLVVSGVQIKGNLNSVCLGSPVTFQNISTGGDKATIIVYDSNKNPIATIPGGIADTEYVPAATGTYYVSITAGNQGCGDAPVSALKEFTVYPVPKPSFTYTIDDQYNVTFTNTTPNAENIPASSLLYSWDFGDGSVKENIYTPSLHHFDFTKSPFTVALTATTPGTTCAGITTQVIEIKFHGNIFLPNAFIPSSSKKDLQVFMAKGFGLKTWHMQIFNNFGQMIWESTKLDSNGSPVEGWDGTYKGVLVEQGVYVWQISATLLNGQEWKGMSFGKEAPRAVGVIHLLK